MSPNSVEIFKAAIMFWLLSILLLGVAIDIVWAIACGL